MDTPRRPVDPAPHAIGMRRRLLGIPLTELAQAAQVTPELLAAIERGEVSPENLHLYGRQTLSKLLDLDL